MSLESITPEDAVEWYLTDREDELSTESRRSIRSGLDVFLEWTTEAEIDDMNAIGGRELQRYKTWRKKTHGITSVSLNGTLAVLRRFLVFAVRIDAVDEDAPEKVPMPNVPEEMEVSYEKPSDELVERCRSRSAWPLREPPGPKRSAHRTDRSERQRIWPPRATRRP